MNGIGWLPAVPTVLLCAEDNYRCQPRPRRAGLALQTPDALAPFLTGAAAESVLITAVDPRCLVADGTPVVRPRGCDRLDVGVTLAAVVGGTRRPQVVGYATVLDFARLDVPQNQTYLARSFPTHKVISTSVVTRSDVADELELRLTIDGELRQRSSTRNMIMSADELVETIARRYPLRAGDIVLTGSPAGRPCDDGAGWVAPGSVVTGQIAGVGSVTARVIAEEDG